MEKLNLTELLPIVNESTTAETMTLQEKIENFKLIALDWAITAIDDTDKLLEVKEVKDLVYIVNTIESSLDKADKPKDNVNILIQNLMDSNNDGL